MSPEVGGQWCRGITSTSYAGGLGIDSSWCYFWNRVLDKDKASREAGR